MNIQLEKTNEVSAQLIVKVEKTDYEGKMEKSLKSFRQKANIPGFRPGMVPMSLIKKQYGRAIKAEEINKILQDSIYGYIRDNKVNMLGEPLPDEEKQNELDFDAMDDFEFVFTLALAPEFDAKLSGKDELPYYLIEPSKEMIDGQVKGYTQRTGEYKKVDTYKENDMLKGVLTQLDAEGNVLENGIVVDEAVLMPAYMKEGKEAFDGAKVDDVVTFNPSKVYGGNEAEIASLLKMKKEEVADVKGDFTYQIKEITRFVDGELNQALFDEVYGKDAVHSEEEFRAKVKEDIAARFETESDYKLLLDVRDYLMKRVGKLTFPDELLKRIMKMNNEEKGEAFVEENYEKSIEELSWHLIKEQLVEQFGVKIESDDVLAVARETTRAQFAQYGMMNIPDDLIDNYAKEMLKKKETQEGLVNRAVELKLIKEIKATVTLASKTVSVDEFNKLSEEK